MGVAEPARLGRAPSRARDRVPAGRQFLVGTPGPGVAEEDRPSFERVEPDRLSRSRLQRDRRNDRIEEVIGGAVVLRDGQVVGERVDVVRSGQSSERTAGE